MYSVFLESGFKTFEKQYYARWLHERQIVSIENVFRGRIMGVNFTEGSGGGLLVEEVDLEGRVTTGKVEEVVADGNSFDMMKGLLRRKR